MGKHADIKDFFYFSMDFPAQKASFPAQSLQMDGSTKNVIYFLPKILFDFFINNGFLGGKIHRELKKLKKNP